MKHEVERDGLFAAMPPLEAKKTMFRMTAGVRGWRRKRGADEINLMFINVRKAHLNAKCDEEEWVELPEEFDNYGRYAKLRRWLYGMRKAASSWEEDYADKLVKDGFARGKSAPTVFWNRSTGVKLVVHGDDFTFSGTRKEQEKMRRRMGEWYDIKDRGLMGSGKDEIKEVVILGRTVKWKETGITYESDAKHRVELMRKLNLEEDSKGATSAGIRNDEEKEEELEIQLEGEERKGFRGEIALLNYLGQDRSDLQYATNQISRGMANPTEAGRRRIKKAVRYLVEAMQVVWHYGEFKGEESRRWIDVHVDSDLGRWGR